MKNLSSPILFGLDKFFNYMVDWPKYLAPWVDRLIPGTPQRFMYVVGVIEILAGLFVLISPKWGSLLVAVWLTSGLFVGLVVKDFIWYPSMRTAYESNVRTGAEQLTDAQGVVQTELNPQGYVQVRGELWRAEVEHDAAPIARGSPVRVQAARGLTLIVTADEVSSCDDPTREERL